MQHLAFMYKSWELLLENCQNKIKDINIDSIQKKILTEKEQINSNIYLLNQGFSLSDFVIKVCYNQPVFFLHCLEKFPSLDDCEHYDKQFVEQFPTLENESELYSALRQFRMREMAKLSLLQSTNQATVEQIFIKLSELAESLIIQARDWLYAKACLEMGTPYDENNQPQQLYILAMGKLGGRELNFSSDIDLIFTYPNQGYTQGGRRSIQNQQFFTRLGQRLIAALDDYTQDGWVYRTDMRLRPLGEQGALVLSFNAMEQYYQEQGRDWERYAMIKARLLGVNQGDKQAQYLQQMLRPFVYRRYIDFSVIQSLREMKNKISREVRRRGLDNNIKLGAGGIREIEFIVQVFQLMRGGREKQLQSSDLLKTLPLLAKLNLLTLQQSDDLRSAYLFLRRVENILQAINDEQTQTLPEDYENQQKLIYACQAFTIINQDQQVQKLTYTIQNWTDFLAILQQYQRQVREVFSHLIGEEGEIEESGDQNLWQDCLELDFNQENLLETLQHSVRTKTKEQLDQIFTTLGTFKHNVMKRPMGERGRNVLAKLLPEILEESLSFQESALLLYRIFNILENILTRTTYLELLYEKPLALQQLMELCAKSQMIAEQIAKHPILLDEMLNRNALLHPIPYQEYPNQLREYLLRLPEGDEEQFIDGLRQFKQMMLLQIAAADVLGALPVMKVSDHLTFLAEAILQSVVHFAWGQVSKRFGVPSHLVTQDISLEQVQGLLVIAYGKLGGIELGYQSDLDLVFLFDAQQKSETIGGRKSISSNEFYLKLSQKIIRTFNMQTQAGILYEVDIRLRPSGDSGLLGCSLKAFSQYQQNEAWTWEKQALVRARVVYGDPKITERFNVIRKQVLTQTRDISSLTEEVKQMREKMWHHQKIKEGQFNLKKDHGGIIDIEFIAQYLVLANAPKYPKLTKWSDNVRIFEQMAEYQILSPQDAEKLIQAYTSLRNRIHHLTLAGKTVMVSDEEFILERKFVQFIWHKVLG